MKKTVSAQQARNNLGALLNMVYYQGAEIIIERAGKPMAKLIMVENNSKNKPDPEKFAGIWEDDATGEIEKNMKQFRKDFTFTR